MGFAVGRGEVLASLTAIERRSPMTDLLVALASAAFFVLAAGYVRAFRHL
jgi:hypothetical protein